MKKYILVILWILIPIVCFPQKRKVVAKSTIKIEDKTNNIRVLLDIDGYYEQPNSKSCFNLIFFEDGTYGPVCFKKEATKEMIKENMSKWIDSGNDKKEIGWGSYYYPGWGAYRIEGDTIIGQRFVKGALFTNWDIDEVRYKIIDRRTIRRIYWEPLLSSDEQVYKNESWWINDEDLYYFMPADSLPSSDCWLKEEKWIWRNESDWKEYMEKIKIKKRKKF
ncbi:MAG: hypothetical protein LBJ17_03995 [Dysgonamonadaceae bacterium]|jgi:hypothetical protein|nr:hypothetical protein [Dysgonamonadaceae bacterium]